VRNKRVVIVLLEYFDFPAGPAMDLLERVDNPDHYMRMSFLKNI
jgi:hypothetical protein